MHARDINRNFQGLSFSKPAAVIIEAAKKKREEVTSKIAERRTRIAAVREEYDISDADLIELLMTARQQAERERYEYMSSSNQERKSIGAGAVNSLLTEHDFIKAEEEAVKRLELIARNLKPIERFAPGNAAPLPPEEFKLSYDDLEYLGL